MLEIWLSFKSCLEQCACVSNDADVENSVVTYVSHLMMFIYLTCFFCEKGWAINCSPHSFI